MSRVLRVHAFLPASRANGPGVRSVLWTQGCTLACPGCFNPETHAPGGEIVPVEALVRQIISLGDTITGVTISGGEPLQQFPAVLELVGRLRCDTTLSILLFTGFSWDEVQRIADASKLLASLDVLIAGRYVQEQRLARDLRGSGNKTVHLLTPRHSREEFACVPEAEVILAPDGQLIASGIDPLNLRSPDRSGNTVAENRRDAHVERQ